MPIISRIGRRSPRVIAVYTLIFVLLLAGALSMLYPFMLMITGSFKSQTDLNNIEPWPSFWLDDTVLFQKYVESKYFADLSVLQYEWHERVTIWDKIEPPDPDEKSPWLDEYLAWRDQARGWQLGNTAGAQLVFRNGREFREFLSDRYNGDLGAFKEEMKLPILSWSDVYVPQNVFRYPAEETGLMGALAEFAPTRPVRDRVIPNLDGIYVRNYLIRAYTPDIEKYNAEHGTDYASYSEISLPTRVPPADQALQRADWEEFVRESPGLSMIYLRLAPSLEDGYRAFLKDKYEGDIATYNKRHSADAASFEEISLPLTLPEDRPGQIEWQEFLQDAEKCPAEGIEIYGPRQAFQAHLAEKTGKPVEAFAAVRLPFKDADYHDCMAHKSDIRWELSTRNYKEVIDYIFLHGRGLLNTVIFCSLAVFTQLLVNPLAAYALSRYKPPSTYKILLICLATMAFPVEVTMIPAFLLLKRFPLWPLLAGGATFFVVVWLLWKFAKGLPEAARLGLAMAAGVAVGLLGTPALLEGSANVSLLNTFAALVMPIMANGYAIFLLKGFFDSLPRELYEASDLDGAGEWTKFWVLTMNLSKPILAVIALRAFTMAYSQFMMALIIIPKQEMWTLMVWIFQLQSQSHQAIVYASLVIAAIPTFLVFVACQGIIMRGIVVPTEK